MASEVPLQRWFTSWATLCVMFAGLALTPSDNRVHLTRHDKGTPLSTT